MRVAILTSVLATSAFASQPVAARPVAPSVIARTATTEQPILSSQDVLDRLGIQRPETSNLLALSQQIAQQVQNSNILARNNDGAPGALFGDAALSAAILTNLNSSTNSNYRDVMLMADADGTEDLVSDHWTKVDDLSNSELPSGWTLTRGAISEHTIANGYTSTVYYYGDSVGNIYFSADNGTRGGQVVTTTAVNLPSYYQGNDMLYLNGDDQIVVTGLAVNPVADLSAFANLGEDYNFFAHKTGEILYVSFWDTGVGLLTESRKAGFGLTETIKSGVLAFPIADDISPEIFITDTADIISPQGFPVTIGKGYPVVFSTFSNIAGLAIDDNGSLYFQQVDLENFTGANITKISSYDLPREDGWQDRAVVVRANPLMFLNTLSPANGIYGLSRAPVLNFTEPQVNLITNYSGMSPTFGNIASLATGPNNILYAALARSLVPTDKDETQKTEGLFVNPDALGPTPAMIISFADTSGAFDSCSIPDSVSLNSTSAFPPGTVPIGDGIADVAKAGLPLVPGVTNFRAFVLGNGPDVRGTLVSTTISDTLQMDLQIDYTIYSGLAVDEESKVYVISGGTPAGVGLNPSPSRGEILLFSDAQPFDRRADYIDLRGNVTPSQPNGGTDMGNGVSNRFDHIFYQAPTDQLGFTPIGLSGLARGFLFYTNRPHPTTDSSLDNLPNGLTQEHASYSGPVFFGDFDPSNQIAGGEDYSYPSRGDDYGNAGSPTLTETNRGGFEFIYREFITETNTLSPTVWNAFYLNSSGSLTFGGGDAEDTPTVERFMSGLPKIAGAWSILDPDSRWQHGISNTFPLQALGFAGVNHFIVRWINVPSGKLGFCGSSNSFAISLYDDGIGKDENTTEVSRLNSLANGSNGQEGPTNLRYVKGISDTLTGYNQRKDGSGNICLTYGRMDLLGQRENRSNVLAGVTPGNLISQPTLATLRLSALPIPGINLSHAALDGEKPFPWLLGVPIGPNVPGTLFNSPATPFEYFGLSAPIVGELRVEPVLTSTFDLRQEGNDPVLSTPVGQPDLNRGQVCFYLLNYTVLLPVVSK
jgi:hypothetical protein